MKLTKIENRKFFLFFFTLFVILLFTACVKKEERTNRKDKTKISNRIKMVETKVYKGYRYSIIKIDGTEYFLDHNGAIVELPKRN